MALLKLNDGSFLLSLKKKDIPGTTCMGNHGWAGYILWLHLSAITMVLVVCLRKLFSLFFFICLFLLYFS